MSILPAKRREVIEAIGAALLANDEIKSVVEDATGNDPYNIYTAPDLPRAKQISQILEQLEKEGSEWRLLTFILVRAMADDNLRRLIVEACPESMRILLKVDDQVTSILQSLQQLLTLPLPANIKYALRPKREDFVRISMRINRLFAYKSLHECLHALQLKLTFGSRLGSSPDGEPTPADFQVTWSQLDDICTQAPAIVAQFGRGSDDEKQELVWIDELKSIEQQIRIAIASGDTAACKSLFGSVQRLIRPRISGLNGKVFEAANQLSFEVLITTPPRELKANASFIQLTKAVRDLKPTMLARVLKHKLWQDAENEFSLIDDVIGVPMGGADDFVGHWFNLTDRVLWLANLDPDREWLDRARKYSDEIADKITHLEQLRADIQPTLESYRGLIRFYFLGIDNMLKSDCGSLRKIDDPLQAILREIP